MKLLITTSFSLVTLWLISETTTAPPLFMVPPPLSFTPPSTKITYSNNNPLILKYENENIGDGSYKYAYEQSDGTKVEQVGQLKNQGTKDEVLIVKGQFQWVSPGGVSYTIRYTTDEEGYKPEIQPDTLLPYRQDYRFLSPKIAQAPPTGHYVASLIG